MRGFFVSAALLASLLTASCSGPAPSAAVAATMNSGQECANPESGIIKPESPGIAEFKLTGPFLVKSLQTVIDPSNPKSGTVFWSKDNASLLVSDFHGPFYLDAGETFSTRQDVTPIGVAYSGCNLE